MEEALAAIMQAQGTLQKAVTELCQKTQRDKMKRSPHEILTKLTRDDDVEAYLEVFKRTVQREQWPREEWGGILAPSSREKHRRRTGT